MVLTKTDAILKLQNVAKYWFLALYNVDYAKISRPLVFTLLFAMVWLTEKLMAFEGESPIVIYADHTERT